MAQVTVRINGYAYTVGCQDGEEEHLQAMAGEVERRIETIKVAAGPSGEARMLVMASLLMADDLYEMGRSLKAAQAGQPGGAQQRRPIRSWRGGWASWQSVRKRLPWTWSIPRL